MDAIAGQQQRWAAITVRLPACVLFLACVAYGIAELTGRQTPVYAGFLLLFLLPVPWALAAPRTRVGDGLLEAWVLIAGAGLVWMAALQVFNPAALPIGWWRLAERAVPVAACLTVATAAVASREMLRLLGVSAACALMVATVLNAQAGALNAMDTRSWGTGHINFLVNTAAPSLLAWLVLAVNDPAVRARRVEIAVLAGGFVALTVTAISTGRRGVALAYAAAMGWFVVLWLWRRSRPLALLAVVAALAVIVWFVLRTLGQDVAIARSDRLMYYGAALDGVRESFPWGYGHFGAMRLQEAVGEHARHLVASGGFASHAHDEFLDVLIDGGPLALLALLALLGVLALRLRRIGDPAVRRALGALGVCVVVHLVTDNCYGTPVGSAWCGVVAGLVFAAPVAGTPTPLRGWLPPVAACLWPLALLAVWGAAHTIPSALLTSASPTVARISHVRQALEPQAVYQQAVFALSDSRPAPTLAEAHVIIDQAVAKVGWTGRLPNLAVRLAEAEGAALRQADMLLRVLRLRPFDRLSYLRLADLAGRNAEVAAMLSAEVRQRLAVITGQVAADADLAAGTPRDIEAATRCFVAMVGAIARKVDWQTLRAPMSGLVSRYGDIPGVAQFAVESICQAPEGTFVELLPQAAVLAWGLRFQGVGLVSAPLCMTPVEARRVLPLLTAIHPELIARCATGLPLAPQWISDEHLRVVRIWGLARLGSPTVP